MKTKIFSLIFLFLISSFMYAQDVPPSAGPAPYVYNTVEPSVVFGDLAATSRGFSYNSTSTTACQLFKYFLGTPGSPTNIGTVQTNFLGSGDQCGTSGNQVIYVIQQISPYVLYSVDTTTGATTNLGTITGILSGHSSGGITSLAWDATTNTAFVVSTSITESQLYTFNISTRVATPVGSPITNAPGVIALGCNPGGSLFGIDLVNDNLYKFNKTTGTATLVGALGYNANYGQDADFDPRDGIFYWAAIGTGSTQLRTIDTASGTSSLVGNYTGQNQVLATIIPSSAGGPTPPSCNYYSSQWCAASAFPVLPSATFYQAAEWLGDTLYVQTPSSTGAAATTINRYTYGGSWSTGTPLPTAKSGGTLTKCNGKLYFVGGGSSVSSGSTDVFEYDPSAGAWTTKAPMPMALSGHGTVNWGDSVLFVVGGPWSGSATSLNVYYYRPASNTWGTITNSLPSGQGRRSHAIGLSGNKIIMAAGYNTGFLKSAYVGTIGSDASQLTWAAVPDVPCGTWTGISRTGGTAYGHYFYLVAGERGGLGGYSDMTFVFNVNTNAWHVEITNKPTAMSNMWASITNKCINDTVRVFSPGGYTGSGSANFEVIGCGPTIVGNSTIISTVPSSYSLSQNYPNPFNPTTKISFSLPKNSDVKLVVFDILGKEVTTLVNDYRTAGTHSVEFNASNLASGVYLYRIEAGDFRDVKRMMLVK